jgi:thioredoxin reductase
VNEVDVLVVGGGPAGLAAAVALRHAGAAVTLVEREAALGGIARHADHTGYGLREFRRLLRGPAYARAWTARAERAGVDIRTQTTVTGWLGADAANRTVVLTSPSGIDTIRARAVLLATGTRERPRSARLVPGTRPLGVMTTGALQQLTALGLPVGQRAVIVGAEHVSFSAVLTLRHHGVAVAAMTTPEARHQSYAALRVATAGRHRVPVLTQTAVTRIVGRRRVEAVELTDLPGGSTRQVECDTVVFTGDWVPDHELARRGDIVLDPGTRAPRVDGALRTRTPGVFAAGNLLHGAETAGVCAASGEWAARGIARWLDGETGDDAWPTARCVLIECDPPLRWISPNALVPGQTSVPHGHFLLRTAERVRSPHLVVRQGTNELWSGPVRRAVPAMPVHLPARWLGKVQAGEPIRVAVAG